MTGVARGVATLLGAVCAGALIWIATRVDGGSTWRYWAVLGLLAVGGLLVALGTQVGRADMARPVESAAPFVIAFLPVLVVFAWIAGAAQPHGNWWRSHVTSWSGDIGIGHLVSDLGGYVNVMAFGLGVVLMAVWPFGARRPATVDAADEQTTVIPRPEPSRSPTLVGPPPSRERGFSPARFTRRQTRELSRKT
jgi:hypothetical protein